MICRDLSDLLHQGRILFVLGSGVSVGLGLPSWTDLVRRLFKLNGVETPDTYDVRTQVDYYLKKTGSRDSTAFLDAVQESLYYNAMPAIERLGESPLLRAIGALLLTGQREGAKNLVSFAFDDFVETYLEAHGLTVRAVSEEAHWSSNADITAF